LDIIEKLNEIFKKIFNEKNVIKYEGISIKNLEKYLEKLKEDKMSMLDISNKIMKLEIIE